MAQSVKHRPHGGGGTALLVTIDESVKRSAQSVARAEGKSLSLWLEDLLRDTTKERQLST